MISITNVGTAWLASIVVERHVCLERRCSTYEQARLWITNKINELQQQREQAA